MNSFSLVGYLSGELGRFLNDLRARLEPGREAQAHITVLPPRPRACSWQEACAELQERLRGAAPFEVVLGDVRSFEASQVVYAKMNAGRSELERLHALTNTGRLHFECRFPYHPHVTLAHGLAGNDLVHARVRAQAEWDEYSGPRTFVLEELVLVQNSLEDVWVDLASIPLGSPVSAGLLEHL